MRITACRSELVRGSGHAELGEEPIPIDIYVCPRCGRILRFANKKKSGRDSSERHHTRISFKDLNCPKVAQRRRKLEVERSPFAAPSSEKCVFYSQVDFVERYHIIRKHYDVNHVSPKVKALPTQEFRSR